jgi:hypothetical protein
MQTLLDLLICLYRHERTARAAGRQMSPREQCALEKRLTLVRGTIPTYVLDHYELLKRNEPELGDCPAALAMATLVSAYQSLPARKRRAMTTFFDLATYPARPTRDRRRPSPVKPRTLGCTVKGARLISN